MDEHFRARLMAYSKRFSTFCLLDSNGISAACGHNHYDWLAAFGDKAALKYNSGDAFQQLKDFHDQQPGWLFGFLGYDLKNCCEKLRSNNQDGLAFPEMYFFRPKHLVYAIGGQIHSNTEGFLEAINQEPLAGTIPQEPTKIYSRISQEEYLRKANAIKEHLGAGDIYELNLCLEFFAKQASIDPEETWQRLNQLSPMPFAGFFKYDNKYLLCASPERFLYKNGNRILSQPIKGTAKRSTNPAEDEKLKNGLHKSEKERCENVMIVDLTRNDLAKSAVTGTVKVEELFGIYSYSNLHQMVSTVSAEAQSNLHFTDIICNAFPMGSMTGCPKIAAMQLIEHYEETKRGLFSGAFGYITPEGDFDFNVVIRSILYNAQNKYLSYQVGSALTWMAEPEQEYEECMLKAANMQQVMGH
ncbi:MAG: anthranilate synthase component I family protein [Flavobacteriaceae bacterium]|nr:anthranilate synthase component I family protein [Flavobacteriaceae bacterium]